MAPEIHRVHKSPLPVPILSHINPVHTTLSYLSETHLNIILPPVHLGYSSVIISSGFPIFYMHSYSPPYILHAPPISSSLTSSF
jgi:hypothetical protein